MAAFRHSKEIAGSGYSAHRPCKANQVAIYQLCTGNKQKSWATRRLHLSKKAVALCGLTKINYEKFRSREVGKLN
jgi:hypothetical protein